MNEFTYYGADDCPLYGCFVNSPASSKDSKGPPLLLLHGGGPDHQSLIPLAEKLKDLNQIILPDIRGYGRSICIDPQKHTWTQYSKDVISLLDFLQVDKCILGGAGIGTTISLRTAMAYPERIKALILISVEDIEDDAAKEAEIAFMEAFSEKVRSQGIEAAWNSILKDMAPIIGTMVREAIPRSNPLSIAAAAAIGRDRSFKSINELKIINSPALIIPGMDFRHPIELAKQIAEVLPQGHLSQIGLTTDLKTTSEFATILAPVIRNFLLDKQLL